MRLSGVVEKGMSQLAYKFARLVAIAIAFTAFYVAFEPQGVFGSRIQEPLQTLRRNLVVGANWSSLTASAAVLGTPEQRPSVLIFGDYYCPYSRELNRTLDELLSANPGFSVAYFQYPSRGAPGAAFPPRAAVCAGEQGKFREMHMWLTANISELDSLGRVATDTMDTHAAAVASGIPDVEGFLSCLASARADSVLAAHSNVAEKLHLQEIRPSIITPRGRVIRGVEHGADYLAGLSIRPDAR